MQTEDRADGDCALPSGWELERLRRLGRGVLLGLAAGIITGILAGGVGSRIAMRIAAVLGGQEIAGLVTENGNVVGDITVEGTVGLLIFAGALPGIAGGWLYVLIRRWLTPPRWWHGLLFGTLLLMTFGAVIINGDNGDFMKLGSGAVNVAMFALLFVLFGLLVVPITGALDRRLPPVGGAMGRWSSSGYLAVLALPVLFSFAGLGIGLPAIPVVLAGYIWWPALRSRIGFLRIEAVGGVQRIAPYAAISIVAIVGGVFLALNIVKIV